MVDELPKLYGSTDGKTRLVKSLYGSVNGIARPISKLYGSVSGRSKLIFQAQAGGDGDFDPVDSNNVDLDNLSNIVKAGVASQYLAVGDLLDIPMADGTVMKRRVLGFGDRVVQIDGVERTVSAIQMGNINLYKEEVAFYPNDNYAYSYSSSKLRELINSTIQGLESEELLPYLGSTKVVTLASREQKDVVYDKLFPPSLEEIGSHPSYYTQAQREAEGPTPSYYTEKRDFRRFVLGETTPARWWSRSVYTSNTVYRIIMDETGSPDILKNSKLAKILVQFNFIGKY